MFKCVLVCGLAITLLSHARADDSSDHGPACRDGIALNCSANHRHAVLVCLSPEQASSFDVALTGLPLGQMRSEFDRNRSAKVEMDRIGCYRGYQIDQADRFDVCNSTPKICGFALGSRAHDFVYAGQSYRGIHGSAFSALILLNTESIATDAQSVEDNIAKRIGELPEEPGWGFQAEVSAGMAEGFKAYSPTGEK
jgi:hypothetical protein